MEIPGTTEEFDEPACLQLDTGRGDGSGFFEVGCLRRVRRQVLDCRVLVQRNVRSFRGLLILFPWLAAGLPGCGGGSAIATVTAATELNISAVTIAFGEVNLNTTATQPLTLTSTGTAPVTINSATISGTGFTYSGASFPLTLNSTNPTATLSVAFDPTTAGSVTGQLTVISNSSPNGTVEITLTGTGVSVATYEVDVTWGPPSSSPDPVAAYDIYRSPGGESDYELMGSVNSNQFEYTDNNEIQQGQSYDYIVESVDSSGNESVPSNTASVTIPD
jgi:hypothetical protein